MRGMQASFASNGHLDRRASQGLMRNYNQCASHAHVKGCISFSLPILTIRKRYLLARNNRLVGPVMPPNQLASFSGSDLDRLWAWFIAEVPDHAILLLDHDGCIATWNRAAEALMRHTAQQIIGRHSACLYTQEDVTAGKPERDLQGAEVAGHLVDTGDRLRSDGSRFPASVHITALRAPDGTLRGFGQIIRDVIQTATAEARLRSLIATVLDTVVDGLITIDRRGVIQSFNKA